MHEIRNYIFDLNWKEDIDYEAKLRDLVETLPGQDSLQARFEVVGSRCNDLPTATALHLYHILQEALANVKRHAQATQIEVILAYGADDLKILVSDNGVGFLFEEMWQNITPWQQGLKNMRRRTELLKGRLEIETKPGKGTKVNLTVPLRDRK
jgi:two-component system sensor histidine kinase DegS